MRGISRAWSTGGDVQRRTSRTHTHIPLSLALGPPFGAAKKMSATEKYPCRFALCRRAPGRLMPFFFLAASWFTFFFYTIVSHRIASAGPDLYRDNVHVLEADRARFPAPLTCGHQPCPPTGRMDLDYDDIILRRPRCLGYGAFALAARRGSLAHRYLSPGQTSH